MVNSGKELCEALSIAYDERLEPYFEEGVRLYREKGLFAVNKERIISANEKYNFIRTFMPEILEAADQVARDENLLLFVYTLVAIYKTGKTPTQNIDGVNVTLMGIPDRERLDTDIAPMFSALYFLEDMICEYEKRGFPHDVISDTLFGMEKEFDDYIGIVGRPGMRRYVGWYSNWVNMNLITVGRFQFRILKYAMPIRVYRRGDDYKILIDGRDMHKNGMVFGSAGQDDEAGKYHAAIEEVDGAVIGYAANEYGECDPTPVRLEGYTEVLRRGDMVLDVHIPAEQSLAPEICKASYERAKEVLIKAYPEHEFKGFICQSWMLEKRLEGLLGKSTNVTKFMDMYYGYPLLSNGKAVYSFIFKVPAPLPTEELPENTTLQRVVKQYMLDGNFFYEKGGFMPLN